MYLVTTYKESIREPKEFLYASLQRSQIRTYPGKPPESGE